MSSVDFTATRTPKAIEDALVNVTYRRFTVFNVGRTDGVVLRTAASAPAATAEGIPLDDYAAIVPQTGVKTWCWVTDKFPGPATLVIEPSA